MDETIAGIANRVVKRNLRYAQINDIQALRTTAVRIVAAERQCYREGTSESTSLDGLAATTFVAAENDNDEDMDYDDGGVNSVKFEGNCRKCGKYGHSMAIIIKMWQTWPQCGNNTQNVANMINDMPNVHLSIGRA